jgi:hypothetical protein
MVTNFEQQLLRNIYQCGCVGTQHTLEEQIQTVIGQELKNLVNQGLLTTHTHEFVLTSKAVTFIEATNIVPSPAVAENRKAREMLRKALKTLLDHDLTGYNVGMQEMRKAFPPRYVNAVERYYYCNLP